MLPSVRAFRLQLSQLFQFLLVLLGQSLKSVQKNYLTAWSCEWNTRRSETKLYYVDKGRKVCRFRFRENKARHFARQRRHSIIIIRIRLYLEREEVLIQIFPLLNASRDVSDIHPDSWTWEQKETPGVSHSKNGGDSRFLYLFPDEFFLRLDCDLHTIPGLYAYRKSIPGRERLANRKRSKDHAWNNNAGTVGWFSFGFHSIRKADLPTRSGAHNK